MHLSLSYIAKEKLYKQQKHQFFFCTEPTQHKTIQNTHKTTITKETWKEKAKYINTQHKNISSIKVTVHLLMFLCFVLIYFAFFQILFRNIKVSQRHTRIMTICIITQNPPAHQFSHLWFLKYSSFRICVCF